MEKPLAGVSEAEAQGSSHVRGGEAFAHLKSIPTSPATERRGKEMPDEDVLPSSFQ